MTVKCLDALHENCKVINNCSRELGTLAGSFSHTGNIPIAEVLDAISLDLEAAQKAITQAYATEIHENMVRAEESSTNLVKAALFSLTQPAPTA